MKFIFDQKVLVEKLNTKPSSPETKKNTWLSFFYFLLR